jgi:hypothetical protein
MEPFLFASTREGKCNLRSFLRLDAESFFFGRRREAFCEESRENKV